MTVDEDSPFNDQQVNSSKTLDYNFFRRWFKTHSSGSLLVTLQTKYWTYTWKTNSFFNWIPYILAR